MATQRANAAQRMRTTGLATFDTPDVRGQVIGSSTTLLRPARATGMYAGMPWFDLTLNQPIWRNKNNNGWVDSAGHPV